MYHRLYTQSQIIKSIFAAEYERQGLGAVIRKGEIGEHVKLASIIDTMTRSKNVVQKVALK